MSALRKNVASQVLTFALINASTGAALTGATCAGLVSKDGTQAASGGAFTELGGGEYKYVPTQAETNVTAFGLTVSATSAIPVHVHCFTTAADPTDAVRMGLTALPNAAAAAIGGLLTAPTTANVGLADVTRILGTLLTETAGQLAGGFKKFFNIAAPASTMDALTLVATATNLTNSPTNGDLTAAMKASVTTAASAATPTAAAVTGNVGGNVVGSVGSVTGLTASDVGAIKTTIGVAGAGLTALGDTRIAHLDADVSSRLATAGYTAPDNATIATIKSETDTILADVNTGAGAIYNRLGAPAGLSLAADVAAVKADSGAVKTQTDKFAFSVANQVDANVVDWKGAAAPAMTGDAYGLLNGAQAEPGQGAPAVNAAPIVKLAYLFKGWRNKKTQTATTFDLFNDAGTVVDQKSSVSDDNTTMTRGIISSGP